MDLKGLLVDAMNGANRSLLRPLEGLTQQEFVWRQGPQCNSIGIVLFHVFRSEDLTVRTRLQGKPTLWDSDQWYRKLNLPADASGHGYTVETLASFPVPPKEDLLAYGDAVRAATADYLNAATAQELERLVNSPRFGPRAVAVTLTSVVLHTSGHAGEIAYLRGAQRGLDK